MDVSLPCTDIKYTPNANFYFNNSDLFSLLSRNLDILPEEFQEILMCKEGKNNEK
jgi:energy-converting hydrogenase A subunit M